jgi:histidinol-phosphatase (PHP family)
MIDGYYIVDCQVHSIRSHDGKASIDDICRSAVAHGVDEIGFTEHKDFDPDDPVVEYFDYEVYMHDIALARMNWGSQLKIKAGVEIDYQVWFEDKISTYLERHPFDFVLGSVHYVNRIKIMTPEYNRSRNARMAYHDYFLAVRDSVVSGLFDVVGHLEYANRLGINAWGQYHSSQHIRELSTLFDHMVEEGIVLEINTAGLFHGTGDTYPCLETVQLYASRGGQSVIIGSDAHVPEQVGYRALDAIDIAKRAGIHKIATFSKRQKTEIQIQCSPVHPGHHHH